MAMIKELRKASSQREIGEIKTSFFSGIGMATQRRRLPWLDLLPVEGEISADDLFKAASTGPRDTTPEKGLAQAYAAIAEAGGRLPVEITLEDGKTRPAHILSLSGEVVSAHRDNDPFANGIAEIKDASGKPKEADVHISPSGSVVLFGSRPVRR